MMRTGEITAEKAVMIDVHPASDLTAQTGAAINKATGG